MQEYSLPTKISADKYRNLLNSVFPKTKFFATKKAERTLSEKNTLALSADFVKAICL